MSSPENHPHYGRFLGKSSAQMPQNSSRNSSGVTDILAARERVLRRPVTPGPRLRPKTFAKADRRSKTPKSRTGMSRDLSSAWAAPARAAPKIPSRNTGRQGRSTGRGSRRQPGFASSRNPPPPPAATLSTSEAAPQRPGRSSTRQNLTNGRRLWRTGALKTKAALGMGMGWAQIYGRQLNALEEKKKKAAAEKVPAEAAPEREDPEPAESPPAPDPEAKDDTPPPLEKSRALWKKLSRNVKTTGRALSAFGALHKHALTRGSERARSRKRAEGEQDSQPGPSPEVQTAAQSLAAAARLRQSIQRGRSSKSVEPPTPRSALRRRRASRSPNPPDRAVKRARSAPKKRALRRRHRTLPAAVEAERPPSRAAPAERAFRSASRTRQLAPVVTPLEIASPELAALPTQTLITVQQAQLPSPTLMERHKRLVNSSQLLSKQLREEKESLRQDQDEVASLRSSIRTAESEIQRDADSDGPNTTPTIFSNSDGETQAMISVAQTTLQDAARALAQQPATPQTPHLPHPRKLHVPPKPVGASGPANLPAMGETMAAAAAAFSPLLPPSPTVPAMATAPVSRKFIPPSPQERRALPIPPSPLARRSFPGRRMIPPSPLARRLTRPSQSRPSRLRNRAAPVLPKYTSPAPPPASSRSLSTRTPPRPPAVATPPRSRSVGSRSVGSSRPTPTTRTSLRPPASPKTFSARWAAPAPSPLARLRRSLSSGNRRPTTSTIPPSAKSAPAPLAPSPPTTNTKPLKTKTEPPAKPAKHSPPPVALEGRYQTGDKVLAEYQGSWHPAEVRKRAPDGTYTLLWYKDTPPTETPGYPPRKIKPMPKPGARFAKGDRVSAQYLGLWYPAEIVAATADNTYTILWYEDTPASESKKYPGEKLRWPWEQPTTRKGKADVATRPVRSSSARADSRPSKPGAETTTTGRSGSARSPLKALDNKRLMRNLASSEALEKPDFAAKKGENKPPDPPQITIKELPNIIANKSEWKKEEKLVQHTGGSIFHKKSRLTIPRGSLPRPLALSITEIDFDHTPSLPAPEAALPKGSNIAPNMLELGPSGTIFPVPVNITMRPRLPPDADPSSVALYCLRDMKKTKLEPNDGVKVYSHSMKRWYVDGVVERINRKTFTTGSGVRIPANSVFVRYNKGSTRKWIKWHRMHQTIKRDLYKWEKCPNSSFDASTGLLTASTTHFSLFAVVFSDFSKSWEKIPLTPKNVNHVKMTPAMKVRHGLNFECLCSNLRCPSKGVPLFIPVSPSEARLGEWMDITQCIKHRRCPDCNKELEPRCFQVLVALNCKFQWEGIMGREDGTTQPMTGGHDFLGDKEAHRSSLGEKVKWEQLRVTIEQIGDRRKAQFIKLDYVEAYDPEFKNWRTAQVIKVDNGYYDLAFVGGGRGKNFVQVRPMDPGANASPKARFLRARSQNKNFFLTPNSSNRRLSGSTDPGAPPGLTDAGSARLTARLSQRTSSSRRTDASGDISLNGSMRSDGSSVSGERLTRNDTTQSKYGEHWTSPKALDRQGSMYMTDSQRARRGTQDGEQSPSDEEDEEIMTHIVLDHDGASNPHGNVMPYEDNSNGGSDRGLVLVLSRSESPASVGKSNGSSESSPAPASLCNPDNEAVEGKPAVLCVLSPRSAISNGRDNINVQICGDPAPASIPHRDDHHKSAPIDRARHAGKRPAAGPTPIMPPGAGRTSKSAPPGRFLRGREVLSPQMLSPRVKDGVQGAKLMLTSNAQRVKPTKIERGRLLTLPGKSLVLHSPRPIEGAYDKAMAGMRSSQQRQKEGDTSSLYSSSSESSGWEEVASRINELEHLVGESGSSSPGQSSEGRGERPHGKLKPMASRGSNSYESNTVSTGRGAPGLVRKRSIPDAKGYQNLSINVTPPMLRQVTPTPITPSRAKFPLPKPGLSIYGGSPGTRRDAFSRFPSLDDRIKRRSSTGSHQPFNV